MPFQPIQTLKERIEILLISRLRGRKPTFIHPIINLLINPLIHLVNPSPQPLRVKSSPRSIPLPHLLRQQRIKLRIKHPYNLTTLITHNRLFLLIPQTRYQIPTLILRIRFFIQRLQRSKAVKGVSGRAAMVACEEPAGGGEGEVAEDELDDGFETFERADEVGAVGPGAAEVEVEGVAVGLGGEVGGGGGGDEGAELGGFAAELAVGVGVFVDWGL